MKAMEHKELIYAEGKGSGWFEESDRKLEMLLRRGSH